jgi:hypothetical protein
MRKNIPAAIFAPALSPPRIVKRPGDSARKTAWHSRSAVSGGASGISE